MATAPILTRRTFLKVSAAAGGGFLICGHVPGIGPDVSAAGIFEPNVWVKITADDTVTMTLTMLEMGQGVMTSMPMLVAEELDIDWNRIKTEWAPADPRYGNPNFGGQQLTAGSNSVRGMWKVLRESGATARAMLITAAAQTWGVAENTLSTEKGEVVHRASGRRLKYGGLVDRAAALPVPAEVALKDPKDFHVLGQSLPRLDIPGKVNGTAEFGLDVKRPGMLVARVVRCPVFGGKVASFNADKARAVPGVQQVVQISTGVAVAADNYWAASKGAQALEINWDEGPLAKLSSAEITSKYAALAQQPGKVARNDGDTAAALKGASKSLEQVYEAPFLAHACMEPMNCTADVRADRCDVWVPTQGQTASQQAATAASGLRDGQGQHSPDVSRRRLRPARRGRLRHRRGRNVEGDWQAGEGGLDARRRHPARLLPSGHVRPHVGSGGCGRQTDRLHAAHGPAVSDEADRRLAP